VKLGQKVIDELMVHPGDAAALGDRSTSETRADWLGPIGRSNPKDAAEHYLDDSRRELESAQELLYADDTRALLLVFQGMDASGKDGTIKHVMSGVNPQGCEVHSFKQPSTEELSHDFLWRCGEVLPERRRIGIFNRSYHEEVLVVRVHPELLAPQHLPSGTKAGPDLWQGRYEDINAFEHHLDRSGTSVVKFFLHVSKEEQLARLDDPAKQWKFSPADAAERSYFDAYKEAYEDALTATSTSWAPWYVIPADDKPVSRALVGALVVHAINELDLHAPSIGKDRRRELEEARKALAAE
jgi:PPK2 family polyphosphate:nucleotide phosphotransferase